MIKKVITVGFGIPIVILLCLSIFFGLPELLERTEGSNFMVGFIVSMGLIGSLYCTIGLFMIICRTIVSEEE